MTSRKKINRFESAPRTVTKSSLIGREGEMPIMDDRLNELESNAVRALLSLGEAFVGQSQYKPPMKRNADSYAYAKPLQPQQINAPQQQAARSVIVKAEPMTIHEESRLHFQRLPLPQTSPTVSSSASFIRELPPPPNGLNLNNQQSTIKFTPVTSTSLPGSLAPPNSITASPVSIQQITSTSAPVISTIFYQIPVTAAAGTAAGTTRPSGVMPHSFTIIPAHNGRPVFPLPMVTGNGTPLVKIEPGTTAPGLKSGAPMNWNNIQLVKVPRSSVETGNFSALAPLATLPKEMTTPTKLLPSPGKGDGKLSFTPTQAANGKTPTKSRARRRSQNVPKGQPRNSRTSSGSSDFVVSSSVDGLPNIIVDGYEVTREIWAKAYLQNDIIHAAGTLFNALFSSDEIKNCTLNGRNGTRQLCPEKRHAIFKIVAWMKNKCQDPYSFNKSPEETKILSRDEQQMIEKKVFVERRYQTSRKIRDLPASLQSPPTTSSAIMSTPIKVNSASLSPGNNGSKVNSSGSKKCVVAPATSSTSPEASLQRRDSTGSFSSICSSGDDKGIPKIALLQSSEIIANYFQSAEPLPIPALPVPNPIIHIPNHKHDGPPPMKMQKVG